MIQFRKWYVLIGSVLKIIYLIKDYNWLLSRKSFWFWSTYIYMIVLFIQKRLYKYIVRRTNINIFLTELKIEQLKVSWIFQTFHKWINGTSCVTNLFDAYLTDTICYFCYFAKIRFRAVFTEFFQKRVWFLIFYTV